MNITYFDPTSTSGPEGYINYKMSGGGSGGSGGGGGGSGSGCGLWIWIFIILFVLETISKLS